MRATAVFDDRECLANAPLRFEKPPQHDRIGQVAEVETRLQATHNAVLRVDQKSQHPLLVQVC